MKYFFGALTVAILGGVAITMYSIYKGGDIYKEDPRPDQLDWNEPAPIGPSPYSPINWDLNTPTAQVTQALLPTSEYYEDVMSWGDGWLW